MGVYDTVVMGEVEGQVKLWNCEMRGLQAGDLVPRPEAATSGCYSVALREGGWVNVDADCISGWSPHPQHAERLDKWGQPWGGESRGILGEGYWF